MKRKNEEDLRYDRVSSFSYDLLTASKSPQLLSGILVRKYDFKLKGAGPVSFNLGCDFTRGGVNELSLAP